MKRDDAAMASAAAELSLGELSPIEVELGGPDLSATLREREEDFLYYALCTARGARLRMDRMRSWGPEYAHEYRSREQALATASRHYFNLIDMGAAISPLLAEMVLAEGGLTP